MTSTAIYPVLPYVYLCTHKETKQFYYGSRWANKVPAAEDLGVSYYTSSKYVKPSFNNFDYMVMAEFFTKEDAYCFEQSLIYENWGNPLLLNRKYHLNENRLWNGLEPGQYKHSEERKQKIRDALTGLKRTEEEKQKNREAHLGKVQSDETKLKMSNDRKGRLYFNNGSEERRLDPSRHDVPDGFIRGRLQKNLHSLRPRIIPI